MAKPVAKPVAKPIKILYLAGWGRSGSTLLARILAQAEGCVHLGELRTLWIDGFQARSTCGCGQLLRQCGVWQDIFQRGFAGATPLDPVAFNHLRQTHEPRTAQLWHHLLRPATKAQFRAQSQPYLQVLRQLYGAIADLYPGATIVDDSLHPGYGYLLSLVPEFEVTVVHLVRDGRACAYSWAKRQKKGLGSYSLRDSALGWNLRNLAVEGLGRDPDLRYRRLRYEDWIQQPQAAIADLLQFAHIAADPHACFVEPHAVRLGISHSVFGNANRTETGVIPLQLDHAWQQHLGRRNTLLVTALTAPLLWRYGY